MKQYRFENAPLLKAFSERPGSDNELDRRRVNERRKINRIETDSQPLGLRGCNLVRARLICLVIFVYFLLF